MNGGDETGVEAPDESSVDEHVGATTTTVHDYPTGEELAGIASAELIERSREAAPTGAVAAYLDGEVWRYLPDVTAADEELMRGRGLEPADVRTVFVTHESSADEGADEHEPTAASAIAILEQIEAASGPGGESAAPRVEAPRMALLQVFGEMVRLRIYAGEGLDDLAEVLGLLGIAGELVRLRGSGGMTDFPLAYKLARYIEAADEKATAEEEPDGCVVRTHLHCVRGIAIGSWRVAVHSVEAWLGHVDDSGTGLELMGIFVERLQDRLERVRAGEAVWS